MPDAKIDPWLLSKLEATESLAAGGTPMLIVLDDGRDVEAALAMPSGAARRSFVYETLRADALSSQEPVISWLRSRGVTVERRFWLVNALLVSGDLALAQAAAARPGVSRIVGNPVVKGLPDADVLLADEGPSSRPAPSLGLDEGAAATAAADPSSITPETIEYGIALINADDVWTVKGVRGEGIVVATMDTGTDWTHPALQQKYRGWNGGTPDHSYSWHDSIHHTTVPTFDLSHGTHVTGTMVGDDGVGNQVGVAPMARWISCRNMDFGNGTPARYLECMEWGLAPYPEGANPLTAGRPDLAADITNNSWTCPPIEGCNPFTLEKGFERLRAAGQMTIAAAGNAGSACSTVQDPPSIYDSVFSIGAVNSAANLASFSGRGPVTSDGSNRLKPNVAAPGVLVRSTVPGGGFSSFSGTSMASPHASGAMALLWSAKPALKKLIRISRCYIEQSAVSPAGTPATCGGTSPTDRPNNMWGWGLVDVLAAIDLGPDGDGDGIANSCDCDPLDPGAFEAPPQVAGVRFAANKQTLFWDSVAPLAGAGTVYDIAKGTVSQLLADEDFASTACYMNNQPTNSVNDAAVPPVGNGYYYLVRAQNSCGGGSYGQGSDSVERAIGACP